MFCAKANEVVQFRFLRIPLGGGLLVTNPNRIQIKPPREMLLGLKQEDKVVRFELELYQASDWIKYDGDDDVQLWFWQSGWKPWQVLNRPSGGDFTVLILESQSSSELVTVPCSDTPTTYCLRLSSERLRIKLGRKWYNLDKNKLITLKTTFNRESILLTCQKRVMGSWRPCWMRSFSLRADRSSCIIIYEDYGSPYAQVLSLWTHFLE